MEEYEKKQADLEKQNRASGPAWKLKIHPTKDSNSEETKKSEFANSAIM